MAFTHGKETAVLVHQFDLTPYFNNADISRDVDAPETTTFGDSDREYIAGLRGGNVSAAGFWDNTATTGSDAVLAASLGVATARVVTVGLEGLTIGDIVYLFNTHSTSYSTSSPVDGVTSLTADFIATGIIDRGFSLHALTAETTTGNASSIDNAASSANGGTGHLHVTSITSGTSLAVLVQHSTDNSVFNPFITFTTVTTTTSAERIFTAGTVNRYTRASWTISGTSYTFQVGFARR